MIELCTTRPGRNDTCVAPLTNRGRTNKSFHLPKGFKGSVCLLSALPLHLVSGGAFWRQTFYSTPCPFLKHRFGSIVLASSSSFVSFTQCSPTCGSMPSPSLSLWPGRQQYRPRLVGGRRGGGPSYVAPRSRNPPAGHRRDSPISSSLFSHVPPLCAVG